MPTHKLFQQLKYYLAEIIMYIQLRIFSTNIINNTSQIWFLGYYMISGLFTINDTGHNLYTNQINHFQSYFAK